MSTRAARVVLLAALAAAAALPAGAAAEVVASATGSGHFTFAGAHRTLAFSALLRSDGIATGQAELQARNAGVRVHIAVDCVTIVGNVATISGIVTSSSDPTIVGFQGIFQVVDNPESSGLPDFASLVNVYAVGTGVDCRVPGEYDLVPVEQGNVQVRAT